MAHMPVLEVEVELDIKGSVQNLIGAMEAAANIIHSTFHNKFKGDLDEETEDTMVINDSFAHVMDAVATFKVYADKL